MDDELKVPKAFYYDPPEVPPCNLLAAIGAEPEETNDEFTFGTFCAIVQLCGGGLGLAFDVRAPEPGFFILLGPFNIWWRRRFPLTVSIGSRPIWTRGGSA